MTLRLPDFRIRSIVKSTKMNIKICCISVSKNCYFNSNLPPKKG